MKRSNFKKILLTILFLSAYNSQSVWASGNHAEGMKHKNMARIKLSDKSKVEIINILKANEELHQSYFKYDAKKVESNAKKVLEVVSKVSDEKIRKLLTFSKVKLAEIKASSSREDNNKNYHLVSMAFIYIVNKYDVGADYNAYSCPMVKKKWLQNSKKMAKVNNPYVSQMAHCGTQDSHH